jgi:hypothetical protein
MLHMKLRLHLVHHHHQNHLEYHSMMLNRNDDDVYFLYHHQKVKLNKNHKLLFIDVTIIYRTF